jgi:hypothetical protein
MRTHYFNAYFNARWFDWVPKQEPVHGGEPALLCVDRLDRRAAETGADGYLNPKNKIRVQKV